MRRIISAVSLLAFPLCLNAQGTAPQKMACGLQASDSIFPMDRVVAIVADRGIFCSDLEGQYQALLGSQGRTRPEPDSAAAELRQLLNNIIDVEVLLYAAALADVTLPAEALDNAIEADITSKILQAGGEAAFLGVLRGAGFSSIDAYRKFNEEQTKRREIPEMFLQKLRAEGKLAVAPVPDSLLDIVVAQQKAAIGPRPATVTFRQLLLPTIPSTASRRVAKQKADSILARLQRGEDFVELAKAESMDTSTKASGGELGPKRRNEYESEFDRWVWALQPGQYSPVIETSRGYHIVKVDRREPAQTWARHIQITPVADSADARATAALADSIVAALRAGASFDSLANKYNDPTMNDRRFVPKFEPSGFPPEYAAAFRDLKPGDVTDPFTTPDTRHDMPTYVIAVLVSADAGGEYTDEEIRIEVRRSLQGAASQRAYIDKLKKQIYIKIML